MTVIFEIDNDVFRKGDDVDLPINLAWPSADSLFFEHNIQTKNRALSIGDKGAVSTMILVDSTFLRVKSFSVKPDGKVNFVMIGNVCAPKSDLILKHQKGGGLYVAREHVVHCETYSYHKKIKLKK